MVYFLSLTACKMCSRKCGLLITMKTKMRTRITIHNKTQSAAMTGDYTSLDCRYITWLHMTWIHITWIHITWIHITWLHITWLHITWLHITWLHITWIHITWLHITWLHITWLHITWLKYTFFDLKVLVIITGDIIVG